MAGIVHKAVKASGEKGLASEWNDDHDVTGDVDFNNNQLNEVKDPTLDQDGATKKYVDDLVAGISPATGLIGAGTVTLLAATVAYDTNFIDIAIGAGDLTVKDSILILITGNPATNQNISFKVDIRDVTAAGSIVADGAFTEAGDDYTINRIRIFNDATNTDIMLGELLRSGNVGVEVHKPSRVDTNDVNVFTTPFTIRLNFKYDIAADAITIIRYSVHKLIGQ